MYTASAIETVIGVKQATVRAWRTREHLSNALDATHNSTGYNQFTRADVFRIGLVAFLVSEGWGAKKGISVVNLLAPEIGKLCETISDEAVWGPWLVVEHNSYSLTARLFTQHKDLAERLSIATKGPYAKTGRKNNQVEAVYIGDFLRSTDNNLNTLESA